MNDALLDVIFRDSLEEFSKKLAGEVRLDLSKIESLAETTNQIKSAFRTIYPKLKFGEDIDIVAGVDSDSGLPIIEMFGRRDQTGINDIKPANRKELFEYIEKLSKKNERSSSPEDLRTEESEEKSKSERVSGQEDSSNRQIPLKSGDSENNLKGDKEEATPQFEVIHKLPVLIKSLNTDNRRVYAITNSAEPGVPKQTIKFVVDPETLECCQLAYILQANVLVSFENVHSLRRASYSADPQFHFDSSIEQICSAFIKLRSLQDERFQEILIDIAQLIEKRLDY